MLLRVHNRAAIRTPDTMPRKPVDPHPPQGDRRSGADRRKVDIAPPGRIDRRRSIDARRPDVVELDMSNSEWSALDVARPVEKLD